MAKNVIFKGWQLVSHTFWYIKPSDVDRVTECTFYTIKKTKEVHSIKSVGAIDANKILKKSSTCFCYFCVDSEFSSCENLPSTKEWEVELLVRNNVGYVQHTMEDTFQEHEWDEYGVDDDHLASCISLGDNFVVNT